MPKDVEQCERGWNNMKIIVELKRNAARVARVEQWERKKEIMDFLMSFYSVMFAH
jgi:hypothetical protein